MSQEEGSNTVDFMGMHEDAAGVTERLRARLGRVDGGGGPPDNGSMEHRVTALETRLDTVLPTLATKHDVSEAKAEIVKWVVGTALGVSVAAVTIITFVLNNASPRGATAAQPPVVIFAPGAQPSTATDPKDPLGIRPQPPGK